MTTQSQQKCERVCKNVFAKKTDVKINASGFQKIYLRKLKLYESFIRFAQKDIDYRKAKLEFEKEKYFSTLKRNRGKEIIRNICLILNLIIMLLSAAFRFVAADNKILVYFKDLIKLVF